MGLIRDNINAFVSDWKHAEVWYQDNIYDYDEDDYFEGYEVYMYNDDFEGDNESVYFETRELALEFIKSKDIKLIED